MARVVGSDVRARQTLSSRQGREGRLGVANRDPGIEVGSGHDGLGVSSHLDIRPADAEHLLRRHVVPEDPHGRWTTQGHSHATTEVASVGVGQCVELLGIGQRECPVMWHYSAVDDAGEDCACKCAFSACSA